MADYYTLASFVIPCSQEQAQKSIEALQHIDGETTDYADLAIWKADSEPLEPEEIIIRHCFIRHPDQSKDLSEKELHFDFSVEPCIEGLWVKSDESINTEVAAIFTQAVLMAFDLPHRVDIQAAHTCSKMRTDAFGGHAAVVTKDSIRFDGLHRFLEAESQAHDKQERYFFCKITEQAGEPEFEIQFLMTCTSDQQPEQRLDDIFVNFRGEGEKDGDNFVWFESNTAAKNPRLKEITPLEFSVMKEHLSVL